MKVGIVSQSAWVHSKFFFVIFCFHLLESMPRFYTMKIFKYTLKFGQHLHKLLWEKK
jgi:hypothetical protein